MYNYIPTDDEIKLITQSTKDVYVRIELLNRDLSFAGTTFEGNLISDNFSMDGESAQRRSYNCELFVKDYSFLVGSDKKIWINKYIRVYYGIKSMLNRKSLNLKAGEIYYWLIGTFTYVNVEYSFTGTDNTLSLTCADIMADFDGTKNGQITVAKASAISSKESVNQTGYAVKIPAGQDMYSSIKATLDNAGIKKYQLQLAPGDIQVPYTIEHTDGVTYNDVWQELCELCESSNKWEYFFDVDGTFIWRKCPSGGSGADNERVVLDNTVLDKIFVSEQTSIDFSTIYNVTEVWGKSIALENEDRYASECTYSNGVYSITLNLEKKTTGIPSGYENKIIAYLDNLDRIGILIPSTNTTATTKIKIDNFPAMTICNSDGTPIGKNRLKPNTVYVFSYRWSNNLDIVDTMYLMGATQPYGRYEETSKDCPFSTTNLGYQIVQRVNDENYEYDDMCYNKAQYLTYSTTQMMDTITLQTLMIPWLDCNQKIRYVSQYVEDRNTKLADVDNAPYYIIKNISWSTLDGTMSMTLYRFVPTLAYVLAQSK